MSTLTQGSSSRSATEKRRLANGATFLFKKFDGAPRQAMSIFIPGGNRQDGVPGTMDMIDRLLTKGTEKRSQEQLAEEIDGLSLDFDIDTKRDYSAIYTTFLEEDLDASLDIISDVFYNPTFADFDREREKVAGEIQMELDSPRSKASDLFVRTIFDGLPYNTVSSVILENLPKMGTIETLKEKHQQIYQPGRMIVSASGDINPDKLAKALEKYFPAASDAPGELPEDDTVTRLRNLTLSKDQYVTFPRDDSSQAHIFKAWLAMPAKHEDYTPMIVMNTILGGGGLSSRLFIELRDKQGLAYNVRSSLEAYLLRGMFYLYIGTEPANKEKCLKGFIEECDKLMNKKVSAKELADAKENILGRRTVYLETAPQLANYIGTNYMLGYTPDDLENVPDWIRGVTSEDIQRVAQEYMSKPSVVSVVGPSSIL